MNIKTTQVTKHLLTNLDRLDPISVVTENMGEGRGKITIECYGEAWSSYWGAMGDRTIEQFFCSCDEHYIAKNLSPHLDSEIYDGDAMQQLIKDSGLEYAYEQRDDPWNDHDLMCDMFGPDPYNWYDQIPKMTNPDYAYFCRIINTVKAALKQTEGSQEMEF